MANNTWSFTGTVLKWEMKRGNQSGEPAPWGKGWIRIQLDPVQSCGISVDNNVIFLHVGLDYGEGPKAAQTQKLITDLGKNSFILIKDARIDKIKRWKKNGDNFEEYFETGVRAYPNQIKLSSARYPSFNIGLVGGKVLQHQSNTVIVAEPYMIPGRAGKKAEWKNREIPLVLSSEKCKNPLVDQNITAIARLSGMGPNLNYAICGYSEDFVIDYDST